MNHRFLTIIAALFLSLSFAQITYNPPGFNKALGVELGKSSFTYKGARVQTTTLAGLLYQVRYEGPRNDLDTAGDVIAAAIGDPGIKKPFVVWMEKNGDKIARESKPLTVNLSSAFTLTFLPSSKLVLVIAPMEADASAFGEPRHVRGSGPVLIREYSDFECPACRALFNRALEKILARYVDTGRARFEYRHFPLYEIHKQAVPAAEASECAADQKRFWDYHDALFQQGVGNYIGIAKSLNLDIAVFAECIAERKHKDIVEAHRAEAESLGLRGTPSMFVGPFQLPNPFDIDSYERYLRMAKAKAAR